MPKAFPEGQERSPLSLSVTYAQRAAMRAAVNKKKSPCKTYGELVMAVLHGETAPLKLKGGSNKAVSILLFITEADKAELKQRAHDADVSMSAIVRNELFGEAFPVRDDKYGRQVGNIYQEDELLVVRSAVEKLGLQVSIHQASKILAMMGAAMVLNDEQWNGVYTDNTTEGVE